MDKKILKNLIVLEGLDGAGTSTQCRLLKEKIPQAMTTFEPTDHPIGKLIRQCLKMDISVHPKTLLQLFVADRNEHIYGKNGLEELCKDHIVVCDRFLFSTLAYQGLSHSMDDLFKLNKDFPLPEVTFFLDTSIENCQKRINHRGDAEELFEKQEIQKKIRDHYLQSFELFKPLGLQLFTIDGNLSIEDILTEELKILKNMQLF